MCNSPQDGLVLRETHHKTSDSRIGWSATLPYGRRSRSEVLPLRQHLNCWHLCWWPQTERATKAWGRRYWSAKPVTYAIARHSVTTSAVMLPPAFIQEDPESGGCRNAQSEQWGQCADRPHLLRRDLKPPDRSPFIVSDAVALSSFRHCGLALAAPVALCLGGC